jgi:methanogenic corrinoid protein MtbC1
MLTAYSVSYAPLENATRADLETYHWPDPYNPDMFTGLGDQAKHWFENTDYVIVADAIKGGILTKALQIRGYEQMFADLANDLDFAETLLDKLLWLYKEMWTQYLKVVGPYVQMVYFTDDIGAQNAMMISPDTFRTLIKPRLTELIDHIKGQADVKFMYHTDGTVAPVIEDIIEMGVDVLNPIQTSATGMETAWLKAEFGDRLCFHGAIDVQKMLPFSTPEEVRYDVAKRIHDLAPGGGYILSPCHDVGADVPPENIVTMFEAAREFGTYPIDVSHVLRDADLNPTIVGVSYGSQAVEKNTVRQHAEDEALDEKLEEIFDDLYNYTLDGEAEPVVELTKEALALGADPLAILFDALIPALEEVGRLFEEGSYFVPEMLIAAKAMEGAMDILKPLIAQTGAKPIGTFVMGTVKGDIHTIGKNLCNVMLEGAGFKVVDIGVNVLPEEYVAAIREHQPEAVGMSAFLTTTITMFEPSIEAITEAGLRDQVKIYVGGAPVTQEFADQCGADGYAPNASALVRLVKRHLNLA